MLKTWLPQVAATIILLLVSSRGGRVLVLYYIMLLWTALSPVKVWLMFLGASSALNIRLRGMLLVISVRHSACPGPSGRLCPLGNPLRLKKLVVAAGGPLGNPAPLQVTIAF